MHISRKMIFGLTLAVSQIISTHAHADNFLLRMGGGHTTGLTYVSVFDDFFVKEVTARAAEIGHNVQFVTAWGGSVAGVDGAIEAVQRGTLDIGLSPIGFEQSRAALLNYSAYVPFTSADPVLQQRVANRMIEEVPALQESMNTYNAHILASMVTEAYGVATNFAWENVDQLRGRRIAMAGTNAPLFTAINAVPVNLGIGEHYTAMQTGLADGSLFFISGMEAFQIKEVADNFVKTGFGSLSTFAAFMNQNTRSRMPEELVKIFDEVAYEATLIVAEASAQRDIEVEEALMAEGINVHELSEEQRRAWAEQLVDLPAATVQELESRGLAGQTVLSEYIRILDEEGYQFPVDYQL